MIRAGRVFSSFMLLPLFVPLAIAQPNLQERATGARPLAMGGAFVGLADDVNAVFYNPAGLVFLSNGDFQATFGKPTVRNISGQKRNISLGSLAFVDIKKDSPLAVGLSLSHLTDLNIRRENKVAVSGAYRISSPASPQKLSIGVSAKYLDNATLNGRVANRSVLSGDVGLLYRPANYFQLGTIVRDVNRPRYPDAQGDKIPAAWDMGLALFSRGGTTLAMAVADAQESERTEFRWGLERGFWGRAFALRVGGSTGHMNVGVGAKAQVLPGADLGLDYGFSYPTDLNKDDRLHLVSLRLSWGGPVRPKAHFWSDSTAIHVTTSTSERSSSLDREPPRPRREGIRPRGIFALGPDDILEISIKNHPELSTGCVVDSWGFIRLPFIGEIKAEGLVKEDLESQLEGIYSSMMVDPQVEILVIQNNSRFVYVMGEVARPGKYFMQDKLVTIRDVIMEAGLLTQASAGWRAFIVRQTSHGPIYIHVNLYKIMYRGEFENNLALQPGDIVHVPMGIFDTIANFLGRILAPVVGVGRTLITGTP